MRERECPCGNRQFEATGANAFAVIITRRMVIFQEQPFLVEHGPNPFRCTSCHADAPPSVQALLDAKIAEERR